jgi:hypothetical protein
MSAPRPMLIVSSPWDQSRNTPREEFIVIRGIYKLTDAEDKTANVEVNAQHNYNRESREAVYAFFGKWLTGASDASQFKEKPYTVEKREDMLALAGRSLPAGAKNYEQIFQWWRENAARQTRQTEDLTVLRKRLAYSLSAEWPSRIMVDASGENIVLSRGPERRDRIPGKWRSGTGSPLLVVHPEGAAAAWRLAATEKAVTSGRPVLAIDAFQTGSAVAPRDRSPRYFFTFNKSDDANRVQDILTAMAWLRSSSKEKIELRGVGIAGVWALFAAAVANTNLALQADVSTFKGADDDFLQHFFVPAIQRAGGLDAALRLTAQYR